MSDDPVDKETTPLNPAQRSSATHDSQTQYSPQIIEDSAKQPCLKTSSTQDDITQTVNTYPSPQHGPYPVPMQGYYPPPGQPYGYPPPPGQYYPPPGVPYGYPQPGPYPVPGQPFPGTFTPPGQFTPTHQCTPQHQCTGTPTREPAPGPFPEQEEQVKEKGSTKKRSSTAEVQTTGTEVKYTSNPPTTVITTGTGGPNLAKDIQTHLAFAIVVTIFCCCPIGICAIVQAGKTRNAIQSGDVEKARKASNRTRRFCKVSLGCGIVWHVLCILAIIIYYALVVTVAVSKAASEKDLAVTTSINTYDKTL